jgi:hypothetical protein
MAKEYKGQLESLTASRIPPPVGGPGWYLKLSVRSDQGTLEEARTSTDDSIVLAVLFTALQPGRGNQQWPVEINVTESTHGPSVISRVRINDDRFCNPLAERPTKPVVPLTPTAFSDEDPPTWGFFFLLELECREYKGVSLDVYGILQTAWRDSAAVLLTFDNDDLIVAARR